MEYNDPWDDLLHVLGQGWPHYRDAARPLISIDNLSSNQSMPLLQTMYISKNNNTWLYLALAILILQMRGVSYEYECI